jgi:DNA-binding GntR family transcriptional regulator
MRSLEKIEKKSAEGLTLASLRVAIVTGTLPPGARLTEATLAEQLGTSRATIRTALHHLVGEGLAVQVPYTGWMVTSLSADDAWELVTLRANFESMAAALAAERATPEARTALADAFEALSASARSRRSSAATAADMTFHRAIVAASGHDRLAEHYRRVAQQISILIASSNALMSDPQLLVAQHKPLLDAIVTRKAKRASDLARHHIEVEGEKLLTHLRSLQIEARLPTPISTIKPVRRQRGTP